MNKNNKYKDFSVLLVEDDLDTQAQFLEILDGIFQFVHSASDGCEGLSMIEKYHPNIILSDIEMPCMNGVDLLTEAKKINPNSVYIFTTAFNTTMYLHQAIDLQVDGYLVKPIHITRLFEKIDEAVSKRMMHTSSKALHQELSKREYEVFLDIVRGVKPLNIAQKYEIKSKTVSTYRKRIMEKMGVNSNTELIRYALTNGLI